jgi:hypothetical protein
MWHVAMVRISKLRQDDCPYLTYFILLAFFAGISGRIDGVICGYSGLSWPLFKINVHKALRLALQAGIAHRGQPTPCPAIVFKPPVFHRLVKAFANIVQNDPRFFIARHGKPDIICTTIEGQVGTAARVAHIAEVA